MVSVRSIILSLPLLSSLARAVPTSIQERDPVELIYTFKTEVVSGDSSKDGLYVTSYHTGAGTSDAVLATTGGVQGFLNDTRLQFNLDGATIPSYMVMGADTNYAQWEQPTIDSIEEGSAGFFINSTGLQYNVSFAGWLACDWYHGAPQLFWLAEYYPHTIPCSCAQVNLIPESVTI